MTDQTKKQAIYLFSKLELVKKSLYFYKFILHGCERTKYASPALIFPDINYDWNYDNLKDIITNTKAYLSCVLNHISDLIKNLNQEETDRLKAIGYNPSNHDIETELEKLKWDDYGNFHSFQEAKTPDIIIDIIENTSVILAFAVGLFKVTLDNFDKYKLYVTDKETAGELYNIINSVSVYFGTKRIY